MDLLGIAEDWVGRMPVLDQWDLRALLTDGIAIGPDGRKAEWWDDSAVAVVELEPTRGRLVVTADAEHDELVDVPWAAGILSRVWNVGSLRSMMGDMATEDDARNMRALLERDGWLHWDPATQTGWLVPIDNDTWLELQVEACERGADDE